MHRIDMLEIMRIEAEFNSWVCMNTQPKSESYVRAQQFHESLLSDNLAQFRYQCYEVGSFWQG